MATFNFTIRATDNAGAFADREFSLNVRKTNIERLYVGLQNNAIWTYRSYDGTGRTIQTNADKTYSSPTSTSHSWNAVAYGNGIWITNATSTNAYMMSRNGLVWETRNMAWTSQGYPGFTFAKGLFHNIETIAAGILYYRTTADGESWSRVTTVTKNTSGSVVSVPNSVLYEMAISDIGTYLIFSRNSGVYMHSTNGVDFTYRNLPFSARKIKFYNGVWFGIDDTYRLWASTDMINWTQVNLPTIANSSWYALSDITYGNGALIATLRKNSTAAAANLMTVAELNQYLYSEDGTNWVLRPFSSGSELYTATFTSGGSLGSHYVLCTFVNGGWVIAPTAGNLAVLVYSTDAINWSRLPLDANVKALWSVDQANY